jgi:hypothetical protein
LPKCDWVSPKSEKGEKMRFLDTWENSQCRTMDCRDEQSNGDERSIVAFNDQTMLTSTKRLIGTFNDRMV